MEDGTAPTGQVVIERVCGGSSHAEGYTDAKGYFSFQLGDTSGVFQDASETPGGYGGRGAGGGQSGMGRMGGMGGAGGMGGMSGGGTSGGNLVNCEIRAQASGYRSQSVSLYNRRTLDDPNIGTILLHRVGESEGSVVSSVSLAAPKDARKAFEKGQGAMKKQKLEDAAEDYEKAVELYPKYASAWCELGKLQVRQKQTEDGRKSFNSAIEADPKFVEPYLQLSLLEGQAQQWKELADLSDRALKLDPFDYPREFFLNAVAHFNLKQMDAAEKSLREAEHLDTRHEIPDCEHLLGIILAQRHDYTAAAEHLRAYLQYRPNANDAEAARAQLAQVEKMQAQAAEPKPALEPKP
jgi:tetratricopeptide (TPR) repeat protein